jgi:hypothetical protein
MFDMGELGGGPGGGGDGPVSSGSAAFEGWLGDGSGGDIDSGGALPAGGPSAGAATAGRSAPRAAPSSPPSIERHAASAGGGRRASGSQRHRAAATRGLFIIDVGGEAPAGPGRPRSISLDSDEVPCSNSGIFADRSVQGVVTRRRSCSASPLRGAGVLGGDGAPLADLPILEGQQ